MTDFIQTLLKQDAMAASHGVMLRPEFRALLEAKSSDLATPAADETAAYVYDHGVVRRLSALSSAEAPSKR